MHEYIVTVRVGILYTLTELKGTLILQVSQMHRALCPHMSLFTLSLSILERIYRPIFTHH